ncbi:MAG: cation:proton antiporter [Planctomycetes bacterium]|nr:cation:proton antiporter [Planctomycetota bacterium]
MWNILFDVVVLLSASLLLGALAEWLRQSAILGYLVAGMLLGPNTIGLISSPEAVETLAELGVTLLLFTIGLEFSWKRLRRTGRFGLFGGSAQVVITLLLAGSGALLLGLGARPAFAIGAMIALSSTACVLRMLVARSSLDSIRGRTSLGVLLVQDMAVIPLILLVTIMNDGGSAGQISLAVGRSLGAAMLLFGVFFILLNYIVPPLLNVGSLRGYRDLPILLAIVLGFGSAVAAHDLGLSPALGAFVAGMLMAESPYATQIRADISALRTLLITLFFSAIGMLGNPAWIAANWGAVVLLVLAIVIGKAIIVWSIMRLLGQTHRHALAAGLCLAQVGEFSFVIAEIARQRTIDGVTTGFLEHDLFMLVISSTIVTLFLTPFLVTNASRISNFSIGSFERLGIVRHAAAPREEAAEPHDNHIVIIGFGPSGSTVGESLSHIAERVIVVDLNHNLVRAAQRFGFDARIGDARAGEVLEHLNLTSAAAVIITIPDPETSRTIIQHIHDLAPHTPIIARLRYHLHRNELENAGAQVVIDEETSIGHRLAEALEELENTE